MSLLDIAEVMYRCEMFDTSMMSIAVTIALLDPEGLKSLESSKDMVAMAAAKKKEEAASKERDRIAAMERYMQALKRVEEFAREAQRDGGAAGYDPVAARDVRAAWEAAESECVGLSAHSDADQWQMMADEVDTMYRGIVQSLPQLVAQLGGGDFLAQLPDLRNWAVTFMKNMRMDLMWVAALTASQGVVTKEMILLNGPLAKLQKLSHEGNQEAYAFSTQVVAFIMKAISCAQ